MSYKNKYLKYHVNDTRNIYKNKYLKYKNKYLALKNQLGGGSAYVVSALVKPASSIRDEYLKPKGIIDNVTNNLPSQEAIQKNAATILKQVQDTTKTIGKTIVDNAPSQKTVEDTTKTIIETATVIGKTVAKNTPTVIEQIVNASTTIGKGLTSIVETVDEMNKKENNNKKDQEGGNKIDYKKVKCVLFNKEQAHNIDNNDYNLFMGEDVTQKILSEQINLQEQELRKRKELILSLKLSDSATDEDIKDATSIKVQSVVKEALEIDKEAVKSDTRESITEETLKEAQKKRQETEKLAKIRLEKLEKRLQAYKTNK